MTRGPRSICWDCIYAMEGLVSCAAFPDGIPEEIITLEHDHRKPYTDDGGVTFTAKEGSLTPEDPNEPIPWLYVKR